MEANQQVKLLPDNAELLMAINHTGKAPFELQASPLWELYGTYSGIRRYRLTKEGYKQFAQVQKEFPQVVQEHLNRAQKELDAEIATQRSGLASKPITYGDGQAIMIIAAHRMGLEPGLLDDAIKQLEGKNLHPMTGAAISQEACRMNNLVRHDATLIEQANTHVKALMSEYGLSKPDTSQPVQTN